MQVNFVTWCENFVERHGFRIVSGESTKTMETVPFHKMSTPRTLVKLPISRRAFQTTGLIP